MLEVNEVRSSKLKDKNVFRKYLYLPTDLKTTNKQIINESLKRKGMGSEKINRQTSQELLRV